MSRFLFDTFIFSDIEMTQIEKAFFVLQQGFSKFLPGTFFTSLKISAVHRV